MSKQGVVTSFYKGATLEYLYSATGKIFYEHDLQYNGGMDIRGRYEGLKIDPKTNNIHYVFKNAVIPKNSVRHGIAIFSNISPAADFIAIVVSGLVDPLVRRKNKVFIENEVLMIGYQRPGDEFYNSPNVLTPLYTKRSILLSRVEIKRRDNRERKE